MMRTIVEIGSVLETVVSYGAVVLMSVENGMVAMILEDGNFEHYRKIETRTVSFFIHPLTHNIPICLIP